MFVLDSATGCGKRMRLACLETACARFIQVTALPRKPKLQNQRFRRATLSSAACRFFEEMPQQPILWEARYRLIAVVLIAGLLAGCGAPAGGTPERPAITERSWGPEVNPLPHGFAAAPIIFTNATVIRVTGDPPTVAQDLMVEAGRIAAISPTGTAPLPSDAELIDATGLFVVPGLWDMHTHLSAWGDAGRDLGFRLLLANGVTGVRDLGGFPGFLPRWREEINQGAVGPRLYYAGQAFSGPGVQWDSHIGVGGESEAREAVRRMKRIGADFIKVHRGVPALLYPAIVDEARIVGLPVVGHVPRALTAEYVSESGQKSIEHLFGIAGWFEDFFLPESIVDAERRVTPEMRQLFAVLRRNETWVTPTTAVLLKIVQAQDESLDRWDRRRYAPHSLCRTRTGDHPRNVCGRREDSCRQ
jgi:hypothetical protein